ncbi:tight adherence protein C [Proteiniborus sp. DW1]|uniref:type II secretion system F family protein n=2 Tax=Proteiniborus sp. DW1 TaxID=1889883 RepID=UPI00092E1152|nr:type II secretion system F family protein [Proteiniborus sp. DW1]SCG83664.1 tight adherence protein C [Proteiniborus sp. DW1]
MIYYPIILWLVFLGVFSAFMGFNLITMKQKSIVYKMLFERKSIYEFAQKIGPTISTYIPAGKQIDLSNKLMYADYPLGLTAESFLGLQAILVLLGIILGLVLTSIGFPFFVTFILIAIAYLLPHGLLNERVEKRQTSIKKDLPSMVGLLATSVRAGVELGTAFEIISIHTPNVLGEELRKAMKEVATGTQRSKAFKNMSERTGVDILSRFIDTINTAEERGGMNISDVLEDFTEDMRIMRKLDMEEKAKKLPTKMLLPIFSCVFIPMLAILLTPAVFTLLRVM